MATIFTNYPPWHHKWNTNSSTEDAVYCIHNMAGYVFFKSIFWKAQYINFKSVRTFQMFFFKFLVVDFLVTSSLALYLPNLICLKVVDHFCVKAYIFIFYFKPYYQLCKLHRHGWSVCQLNMTSSIFRFFYWFPNESPRDRYAHKILTTVD